MVPETESQGRVHTSTCTVAILPEVDEVDHIEINADELRIDTYRAQVPAGSMLIKPIQPFASPIYPRD